MRMLTPRFCSTPQILLFLAFAFCIFGNNNALQAEEKVHFVSSPKTRTIVAEFLMMDGGLYIVRGEGGEIQIEVTPDTNISEKFTFGDRIKAVLLPNDVAQSITRAAPDEPFGTISTQESEPSPPAPGSTTTETTKKTESSSEPVPPPYVTPKVRVIIADLLMVDGNFYIVRTEHGEIQIEITADTERSEEFKFGDTIKARITPSDVALSVVRASKNDRKGFQDEITTSAIPPKALTPVPLPSSPGQTPSEKTIPEPTVETPPSIRTIVADVLMVDGDFYIVRGEKGEIRIEVTPKTVVAESFNYGDRIKAKVLPDDKALTIERANPKDPDGITTQ